MGNCIPTTSKLKSKLYDEDISREFEYVQGYQLYSAPNMAEPAREEIELHETDLVNENLKILWDYISSVERNMERRLSYLESIPACSNRELLDSVINEHIELNFPDTVCEELQMILEYVVDMEKRFTERIELLERKHKRCTLDHGQQCGL